MRLTRDSSNAEVRPLTLVIPVQPEMLWRVWWYVMVWWYGMVWSYHHTN
jgi:hypothetical protein